MAQSLPGIIPANQSESNVIAFNGFLPAGIFIPADMSGTTLTFNAHTNITSAAYPVGDTATGDALTITIAAGQYVPIDPAVFAGINFLSVVSGTQESAQRTLVFMGT